MLSTKQSSRYLISWIRILEIFLLKFFPYLMIFQSSSAPTVHSTLKNYVNKYRKHFGRKYLQNFLLMISLIVLIIESEWSGSKANQVYLCSRPFVVQFFFIRNASILDQIISIPYWWKIQNCRFGCNFGFSFSMV